MTRQAAHIGLEFVDAPPPPQRQPRRADLTMPLEPKRPRLKLVPDDYVAPDSQRAHGTRAKYVVEKCRCEQCRAVAIEYERRRQRAISRPDETWVPYVSAVAARRRLKELAAQGVGSKTVATISGVPHGTLSKLMYGDSQRGLRPSKRIRPDTERRILAVTVEQAAGHQKVPAGPTWLLVDDLIARGFTRSWIGRELTGNPNTKSLQLHRTAVFGRTARAVEDLHQRLKGVHPADVDAQRRTRWDKP